MSNAVVLLSGGQDSTTCLYWAIKKFDEVWAVGFNYGQSHVREVEFAEQVTSDFIAMDMRQALYWLGEITGEVSTDDILGNIFSKFCIGK